MSQEEQGNQVIDEEEEKEEGGHEEDFNVDKSKSNPPQSDNFLDDTPPEQGSEFDFGDAAKMETLTPGEQMKEINRLIKIQEDLKKKEELEQFKVQKEAEFNAKYKPSTAASLRIIKDLIVYETEKRDGNLSFTAGPTDNDIFVWTIKVNRFREGSKLSTDIQKYKNITGRNYVEFKVLFPPDYSEHAPFIYCVQPRFAFHTGHITVGGSICHEVLTDTKWNKTMNIVSLMNTLLLDIEDGEILFYIFEHVLCILTPTNLIFLDFFKLFILKNKTNFLKE